MVLDSQIYCLDPRLLDARRPPKDQISAADKEEGLLPYQPTIPLVNTAIVSYSLRLHDTTGIALAPTNLESTTHMLAYGTDIFYTRLSPSGAYDMLSDDFNKTFVATTIVGTAASCLNATN